jgi:hypothetical protein
MGIDPPLGTDAQMKDEPSQTGHANHAPAPRPDQDQAEAPASAGASAAEQAAANQERAFESGEENPA